jgi:hypothetical protein
MNNNLDNFSTEQKKSLISIRNWALEALVSELKKKIIDDIDVRDRMGTVRLVNEVLKAARTIVEMTVPEDKVMVLPVFSDGSGAGGIGKTMTVRAFDLDDPESDDF